MISQESGWLTTVFLGNSFTKYLTAVIIFLFVAIVLRTVASLIVARIKAIARKTSFSGDDVVVSAIERIKMPLYAMVGIYLASSALILPKSAQDTIYAALIITIAYYAVVVAQQFVHYFSSIVVAQQKQRGEEVDTSVVDLIVRFADILLWVFAILAVLQNLGYEVSALVAGLGIGGIAIAFALQNVLSDILASISIYFDKPFRIGDFIVVGTDKGTVKKVGIKTTRLQTPQGPELIIANKELTEARVMNYRRMEKRRIVFSFGIVYETPVKKVRTIPKIIKKVIALTKNAELDRVHFTSFGDSSLIFEVVYYMKINDYTVYMDTQQEINLKIMEEFEKEKIEFAYPTQTLLIHKQQ